jgi:predicted  nucleic acid-binding Zn-ribbon protein
MTEHKLSEILEIVQLRTTQQGDQLEDKFSEILDIVKQQKTAFDELNARYIDTAVELENTRTVVHQLVGGLFDQTTQRRSSIVHTNLLRKSSEPDESVGNEIDSSVWGIWPTTRQGTVLEERLNDMAIRMNHMNHKIDAVISKQQQLERRQDFYESYQSDMASSCKVDIERVYNTIDALESTIYDSENGSLARLEDDISKAVDITLKSRNELSGDICDIKDTIGNLKEALRDIGSGLYNMETQRGAWKNVRELFVHDETFNTMPKEMLDSWSKTTSKWSNLPTTRQGDECEARLDKIDVKMKIMMKTLSSMLDSEDME